MAAIDPDILATLTDEERQAIEEGITDSEKEALEALAGEDGDDDDDDDDSESESGEGAAPVEGKGAAEDPPAASNEAPPAAADDDEPAEKFKPKYEAALPDDFDAQVKSVQDETRAIAQQFKDGDIDFDEFEAKRSELEAKRDELREMKVKAEIASEMTAQTAQQEWNFTVKSFVRQVAKSEGIDYAADEAKRGDLDMFIKALANDPKNAKQDMAWFLEEAHKRVKALNGVGKQEAPANAKPEKPNRKPPIDAAPKTLAQVPGGEGPGDVGDEFADLDGLDGPDLERAIAKMTPAQREKFAMGA
jgi:hypothetical protein